MYIYLSLQILLATECTNRLFQSLQTPVKYADHKSDLSNTPRPFEDFWSLYGFPAIQNTQGYAQCSGEVLWASSVNPTQLSDEVQANYTIRLTKPLQINNFDFHLLLVNPTTLKWIKYTKIFLQLQHNLWHGICLHLKYMILALMVVKLLSRLYTS